MLIAEVVADLVEPVGRWFDVLLGTPLQVAITIVVGLIALAVVRMLISRVVDRIVAGSPAVREHAHRLFRRSRIPLPPVDERGAARRVQRAQTMGSVLRSTASLVIGLVVLFVVLDLLGVNIAPLIASAGVAGVALGFGAQTLVKDFLSGLFLLIEDQYGVGDIVDLGEAVGTVEAVGLRVTQVRALDGTLWFIRNGELLRVGNMTQGWARAIVDIRVPVDADIPTATELLLGAGRALTEDPELGPLVLEEPTVTGVEELAADAVRLRIMVKTAPAQQWAVQRVLRARIRDVFAEAGVPLALTRQEVLVRDEAAPDGTPPQGGAAEGGAADRPAG